MNSLAKYLRLRLLLLRKLGCMYLGRRERERLMRKMSLSRKSKALVHRKRPRVSERISMSDSVLIPMGINDGCFSLHPSPHPYPEL